MFYEFLTDPDLETALKDFDVCELVLKVAKGGEKIPVEVVSFRINKFMN